MGGNRKPLSTRGKKQSNKWGFVLQDHRREHSAFSERAQRAKKEEWARREQEILDLAVQDISVIKRVLSSGESPEALAKATHLVDGYQQFLQKIRVEHNMPRVWEDSPSSQVGGRNTAACVT